MQQCIQAQLANPLEPWPHTNTRKLNRAGGNQSVYSTCHPSFGKICLFALNSVKTLNKHSPLMPCISTSPCLSVLITFRLIWAAAESFEVYCWRRVAETVTQVTGFWSLISKPQEKKKQKQKSPYLCQRESSYQAWLASCTPGAKQ